MKVVGRLAFLLPIFVAARVDAAPNWKAAPNTETGSDSGSEAGLALDFDLEAIETEWLRTGLEFLGNYYGYMAVVFVLLVLFLVARRSGTEEGATAADGDEDFFEPGEADRFRRSR